MEKIKIIHLVNGLGLDGSGKVVMSLCNLFSRDAYEVSVVSLTPNIPLTNTTHWPKNVSVYTFNFQYDTDYSLRGYFKLFFNRKITREKSQSIVQSIQKLSPDILHCHIQPRELMIINAASSMRTVRMLYTDHSTRIKSTDYSWLNRRLLAWIYRRMYKKFHVVAVSKGVYEYHDQFNIVAKKKFHWLVQNTVDTDFFVPLQIKNSSLVRVIYVARLHSKKGQEVLIRAWSLVESSLACELLLVGSGEEERNLKTLASMVASKFPIVFTGNSENVLPLLQSSDIGVFPSFNEGLPLSLLEKMSCGLPVIVSRIPEFEGLIQEGQTGLFFEPGNFKQLAEKLQLLIGASSIRKSMGENARQFIIKNFGNGRYKKDYENIYHTLVSLP